MSKRLPVDSVARIIQSFTYVKKLTLLKRVTIIKFSILRHAGLFWALLQGSQADYTTSTINVNGYLLLYGFVQKHQFLLKQFILCTYEVNKNKDNYISTW